jgi:hypothetical protein
MSFEIEGKLHKKFDTEQKTDTFQAREFVIETMDGSYTQYIKFQLVQDRCSLIDEYQEGEPIKVFFDLRGREWNGKYFTNLNAWRIAKPEAAAPSPQAEQPPFPDADQAPLPGTESEPPGMDDDLPF